MQDSSEYGEQGGWWATLQPDAHAGPELCFEASNLAKAGAHGADNPLNR